MKCQNHRSLPILFCFTLLAIALPAPHRLHAQSGEPSANLTELRAESYGGRSAPLDRCPEGCHSVLFNHWFANLPSLPGQRSSLIVIGDISTCTSRLTKDKSDVFTECTLKIGTILKAEKNAPGSIVTVTREGGSVSADGKEMSLQIPGQRLPSANRQYAFFLDFRPLTDDYKILTFYELTDHGIKAGDELAYFHKHDGKSLDAFLDDVNASILDETPYMRPNSGDAK